MDKDFVTSMKKKHRKLWKALRLKLSELLQDSNQKVESIPIHFFFCNLGWSWHGERHTQSYRLQV